MNKKQKGLIFSTIAVLLVILLTSGCGGSKKSKIDITPQIELGTTIGQLAEVFAFDQIRVEGVAIVGGLNGTGSPQCPAAVRSYLEKYILRQLPQYQKVDKLIESSNTAVVLVEGVIPPAASKGQRFDIRVTPLAGTQTTSLENGILYGAELKKAGSFGISTKVLARAEGLVFINKITDQSVDEKTGYILGGAKVLDDYNLNLAPFKPDYKITALIRDRLNERFGSQTAKAISPDQIDLKVPPQYKNQKGRFISLVKALYLTENRDLNKERIQTFVRKLATSEDKYSSEIALEMLGRNSLDKLALLLDHSNEEVRLRAARCMLFLGSNRPLTTIRRTAMDKNSRFRIQALEAIIDAAGRNDAATIARTLLRDDDLDMRIAAYKGLQKIDDIAIRQKTIAGNFYLEQVAQTSQRTVYVSRTGWPRIALFGCPIYCRENTFVESADGNITINAPVGQSYVSLIRKHPKRPGVLLRQNCSYELADVIETLCNPAVSEKESRLKPGLGVSYSDMIALLEQMVAKKAIDAQFRAGSLSKIP